jgi:hypothetical protein
MKLKYIIIFFLLILIIITPISAQNTTGTIWEPCNMTYLNETHQEVSNHLWNYSQGNESFYIRVVFWWTNTFIKPDMNSTFAVRSPERTMYERKGDCSEYSLLITQMLNYHGINASVIHGFMLVGGYAHDSVEIHQNNITWIIDKEYHPSFNKIGDGLFQQEWIY